MTDVSNHQYPSREEFYSRAKGVLEVDILRDKRVAIIGLGSFGSHIAVELAKAGVETFHLFDFDTIEVHNLARHTASVHDIGRLKTDVMEETILGKNPYATVHTYPIDVHQQPEPLEELLRTHSLDLILCATDNNHSRFLLSQLAAAFSIPCIYGRAVTRAEGGDVFIQRPGEACYCCLVGNDWFDVADEEISNEASARKDGRIPAYASAEDTDIMVQVGLSSDILPICNMMVKLALVELSRGMNSGLTELEKELPFNYYLWANRRERRHKNWAPFSHCGNLPTILRWYGAQISRKEHCAVCSDAIELEI